MDLIVTETDPGETVRRANTDALNAAIARGGRVDLPEGRIYVDQSGASRWCLRAGPEVNGLALVGAGAFATTLVMCTAGRGGDLHAFVLDGCSRVELAGFGLMQERIGAPDIGQQNHLLCLFNSTGKPARMIRGHDLAFDTCIGDAIRILAYDPGHVVDDVAFDRFTMQLDGVVASDVPNGRYGARSGIAIQRGARDCRFSRFSIRGMQNSAIDEEPSGAGHRAVSYRDFVVVGRGPAHVLVSLGGTADHTAFDGQLRDGRIVDGTLTMLGKTSGYRLRDVTVECAAPATAAMSPLVTVRRAQDLRLDGLTVRRRGSVGTGIDLASSSRVAVRDPAVDLDGGAPLVADGVSGLSLDGLDAVAPEGLVIKAVTGNTDDLRVRGVRTPTAKTALTLAQRTPYTMTRGAIDDVLAPNAACGVRLSTDTRGGTASVDHTRILCAGAAFLEVDQNDNPKTVS